MTIVIVLSSGVHINPTYPYLGASPDGAVYDPTNIQEQFGFLEVKETVHQWKACAISGFYCFVDIVTGAPKSIDSIKYEVTPLTTP